MANAITRAAKPMEFEQYVWGDIYQGTMPQLLETGKFSPEWFPGIAGNKPTSATRKHIQFESRPVAQLRIWRKDSTRRRFSVWVEVDEQEREARRKASIIDQAKAKSMERATAWLCTMAKSREEFLALNIYSVKQQMGMQVNWMKSSAGYSLSDDSLAKLHAALDAMVQDLIGAEVSYSPDEHEAKRNKLAVDAFENQGMGRMIDQYPEFGFDREAEKAKFVAEALAIPVEGYRSAAIGEYMSLF